MVIFGCYLLTVDFFLQFATAKSISLDGASISRFVILPFPEPTHSITDQSIFEYLCAKVHWLSRHVSYFYNLAFWPSLRSASHLGLLQGYFIRVQAECATDPRQARDYLEVGELMYNN